MPPAKGIIWGHFLEVENTEGTQRKVICKYCKTEYTFANATRMTRHLTKLCMKCPANVKNEFEKGGNCDHMEIEADEVTVHVQPPSSKKRDEPDDRRSSVNHTSASSSNLKPEPETKKTRFASFFGSMTTDEKNKLDEAFARAVYAKGCSLSIFEGHYMTEAFRTLRPTYKPPEHHALGGKLLDAEYARVMENANTKISNSDSLTLMTDGWTNKRSEDIVGMVVGTPEPIFLKSVEPGVQKEDAGYISDELQKVVVEVEPSNVFLGVSDNASVMRAAWKLVQLKYPHIFVIGCGSHCLNLLFKDFMCLLLLKDLFSKAKTVIKIKKTRRLYAAFKTEQKEVYGETAVAMVLPASTRFCGMYLSFVSVQANKRALQETVIMESVDVPSVVRSIVLDNDGFWSLINFAVNFLKPIADGVKILEADDAKLSHKVAVLMNIIVEVKRSVTGDECPLAVLNAKDLILKKLEHRIKFTIRNVHLATYLIDPNFCGEGLCDQEIMAACNVITDIAVFQKLDAQKGLANLLDFRTKKNFYEIATFWKTSKSIDPIQWWKGFCLQQPLCPIAIQLLSAIPTSTSCERVWSAYEHIHSKKRNRLLNKKTEKLVAVKSNLQILNKTYSATREKMESHLKVLTAYPKTSLLTENDNDEYDSDDGHDDCDANVSECDSDIVSSSDDDC